MKPEINKPKLACWILGIIGRLNNEVLGYTTHHSLWGSLKKEKGNLCGEEQKKKSEEEQMEATGVSFTIMAPHLLQSQAFFVLILGAVVTKWTQGKAPRRHPQLY